MDGTTKVIVALPSVLANARPNAVEASRFLREHIQQGAHMFNVVPCGGLGISIGSVNESTDEVTWLDWTEFSHAFSVA